jgi:GT2 family glycosyltransferase
MAASFDQRYIEAERQRPPAGLAIVILNWNGWHDTVECLESIYRSRPPQEWQVVVVDNGSTDESIEKIQRWAEGKVEVTSKLFTYDRRSKPIPCVVFDRYLAEDGFAPSCEASITSGIGLPGPPLIVIRVPENLGYAGGNNLGIRYALRHGFQYIGLLNNDTVVDPEMLGRLVRYLNEDKGAGVVGVKTLYYDDPGTIWYAGADLNMLRGATSFCGIGCEDGPDFSGTRPTDVVSGHALFARREVFERVGLLDEDLFLIWEDTELCIRAARRSSFRICINLDVHLWHKGGGISSSGLTTPISTYFANRNRLKVVWRYGTWTQRIGFLVYYLASRVPKFALLTLRGKFTLVGVECRAVADFFLGRSNGAVASGLSKAARKESAEI